LHPASTTHRQLSKADLEAIGIKDNLIRLSVGIENADDIIDDISNALAQI
jgi:O-acetylhomoserine (thiol)-lyase